MIDRFCLSALPRRFGPTVVATATLLATLTACWGGDEGGTKIAWIPGTPPGEVAQIAPPDEAATDPTQPAPTETIDQTDQDTADPAATAGDETAAAPTPTEDAGDAGATPTQAAVAGVTGRKLSADELARYQPNELGEIPVLEYHELVTSHKDEAQFARTIHDFRADLEWLYKHDFYVVPLRDVIADDIKAPAGKHPVVLTFDDSYASQFRYLIAADGSVTIDPNTAVGVMEDMYTRHPDFGRGGFFAVIPNFCFDWDRTPDQAETDQTPYCPQKIGWLLDNGYEIGNHTRDHTSLYDVTDDEFATQIGGAIEALQAYDPRVTADIIAMPYGDYPKKGHDEQRDMLRNGFQYDGRNFQMLGCLMVGANPSVSPVSTEWDPLYIPRIQAWDNDARKKDEKNLRDAMSLTDWFDQFASTPQLLYTSDGDPATITVPNELTPSLQGTFDQEKAGADGKKVVRY